MPLSCILYSRQTEVFLNKHSQSLMNLKRAESSEGAEESVYSYKLSHRNNHALHVPLLSVIFETRFQHLVFILVPSLFQAETVSNLHVYVRICTESLHCMWISSLFSYVCTHSAQ